MTNPFMPHLVLGDPRKPIVVLVAGFPDDCVSGWSRKVLQELQSDYFLISICFPGFDRPSSNRSWGYDFDTLVTMMHHTISSVISTQCLPEVVSNPSYYLLLHDWGSYLGQLYENRYPSYVKRVCLIDVGNFWELRFTVYLTYQYMFGLAYIISQLFGYRFGNICFLTSLTFMMWFPFLGPTKRHPKERLRRDIKELGVDMCYPYYYFAIRGLFGKRSKDPVPCACPILFIYGGWNNVMLHSPSFLRQLALKISSKSVFIKQCGHWPTLSEPDLVLYEIREFFDHHY